MRIIKRELYLSKIRKYYDIDLIKVLTGVRRCGKSIILNQIMDELKLKITENHIIYMNFEDFEFEEIKIEKEQKIIDLINILTLLHSKTTMYKEIDIDYYKYIYEETLKEMGESTWQS